MKRHGRTGHASYVTINKTARNRSISTLDRAIEIATEAHKGQFNKAGNDYIGHPLRVMEMGKTEAARLEGPRSGFRKRNPLCRIREYFCGAYEMSDIDTLKWLDKYFGDFALAQRMQEHRDIKDRTVYAVINMYESEAILIISHSITP